MSKHGNNNISQKGRRIDRHDTIPEDEKSAHRPPQKPPLSSDNTREVSPSTKTSTCSVTDTASQRDVFNALGDVITSTSSGSCRNLTSFGIGDNEKRVCLDDLDPSVPCLVVSVGCNNQWGFEEEIVSRTHCSVKTFDCTGDFIVPIGIKKRVKFHKLCVGGGDGGSSKTSANKAEMKDRGSSGLFISWAELVKTYGQPTVLKMDIEGWEWSVLREIIAAASSADGDGGDSTSVLPRQIAMEIHACSFFQTSLLPVAPYVDASADVIYSSTNIMRHVKLKDPKREISALMEELRDSGLVLIDRHDNPFCPHCSEIVLRHNA